jgi:hypothetical protein
VNVVVAIVRPESKFLMIALRIDGNCTASLNILTTMSLRGVSLNVTWRLMSAGKKRDASNDAIKTGEVRSTIGHEGPEGE